MKQIIIFFITFYAQLLASFLGALLGNYWWHRRKWRISLNEESRELELQTEERPGKVVEYLPDADAEELEDMERPSFMRQILDKVVRPKKDDN